MIGQLGLYIPTEGAVIGGVVQYIPIEGLLLVVCCSIFLLRACDWNLGSRGKHVWAHSDW